MKPFRGPTYRMKMGQQQKRCPMCEKWKSIGDFSRRKPRHSEPREWYPRAYCKRCESLYTMMRKGYPTELAGWVPYRIVRPAIEELVRRYGLMNTARKIGITQKQLWNYRHFRTKSVKVATFKRIAEQLVIARAENIVYHKDSIHHGAEVRGRKIKTPKRRRDYYDSVYDVDREYDKQRERAA